MSVNFHDFESVLDYARETGRMPEYKRSGPKPKAYQQAQRIAEKLGLLTPQEEEPESGGDDIAELRGMIADQNRRIDRILDAQVGGTHSGSGKPDYRGKSRPSGRGKGSKAGKVTRSRSGSPRKHTRNNYETDTSDRAGLDVETVEFPDGGVAVKLTYTTKWGEAKESWFGPTAAEFMLQNGWAAGEFADALADLVAWRDAK